jgi:hypothetical protein
MTGEEATMQEKTVYCSACDREVLIAWEPPQSGVEITLAELEVVCFELGESCTGAMCPLSGVSPDVMKERLEQQTKKE